MATSVRTGTGIGTGKANPGATTRHRADQRYRRQGVYVVIGGAGGIGEVWSRFMIETYEARIVWIGRRPQDAAIHAKLEALATLGHEPLYISADATDRAALESAYREIANAMDTYTAWSIPPLFSMIKAWLPWMKAASAPGLPPRWT